MGDKMDTFYMLLVVIATAFVTSLIFGFALVKIYGLFQRGVRENNQWKIWWSFSSVVFLFAMVVFLFSK